MKRLFLALWPDESIRQQCVNIVGRLLTDQVEPVLASNIHVTLLFLGSIDSVTESALKQGLARIPVPEITLNFDSLSFWEKPKILCLTSTKPSPDAEMWVEKLSSLARELVIPIDNRPFKPHVTLVKKVKTQRSLEYEPIIWRSSSFCLVESCRVLGEIQYRIVEQWGDK